MYFSYKNIKKQYNQKIIFVYNLYKNNIYLDLNLSNKNKNALWAVSNIATWKIVSSKNWIYKWNIWIITKQLNNKWKEIETINEINTKILWKINKFFFTKITWYIDEDKEQKAAKHLVINWKIL